MFEQMYYSDFTEKEAQIGKIDGNLEQLSKNDRRFVEILDAGTRKNGNHYEVPLPFKQKGIKIQTNKSSFKKDAPVKEKVQKRLLLFSRLPMLHG